MSFERITKDMNIIAQLDDEPNDVGGLTSAALKAKFDEGGKAVKDAFNGLLDELEASTAAASIGARDADGNDGTVQDALDKINQETARIFDLSSLEDLDTAKKAVDHYNAGGLPILRLGVGNPVYLFYGTAYTPSGSYNHILKFERVQDNPLRYPSCSKRADSEMFIYFDAATGTVGYVSRVDYEHGFIEPDYNYSIPYTPLYPGSPATKKYVDEHPGVKRAEYGVTSVSDMLGWIDAGYDVCIDHEGRIYRVARYADNPMLFTREVTFCVLNGMRNYWINASDLGEGGTWTKGYVDLTAS